MDSGQSQCQQIPIENWDILTPTPREYWLRIISNRSVEYISHPIRVVYMALILAESNSTHFFVLEMVSSNSVWPQAVSAKSSQKPALFNPEPAWILTMNHYFPHISAAVWRSMLSIHIFRSYNFCSNTAYSIDNCKLYQQYIHIIHCM